MKTIIILSFISIFCFRIDIASAQKARLTGPNILVYKTKKDYRKLVPVILSEDKSQIVSYPDPHDIKTGGDHMLPITLHKGYLMD